MSHLLALLTDNVRNAVQKLGATSTSVYIPAPRNAAAPGLLLHVGDGNFLPELIDLESAAAFAARAETELGSSALAARLNATTVPSTAASGWLLPIPMFVAPPPSSTAGGARPPEAHQDKAATAWEGRRADRSHAPVVGWIGLRLDRDVDRLGWPRPSEWRKLLELSSALASTYSAIELLQRAQASPPVGDDRNMRLLWDVLREISSAQVGEVAEATVARVFAVFGAARVALLMPASDGTLSVLAGLQASQNGVEGMPLLTDSLSAAARDACARAFASGHPQHDPALEAPVDAAGGSIAVPLKIEQRVIGAFYVQGPRGALLDDSDLPALTAVAWHLAVALDRERLAREELHRQRHQQATQRTDLDRLRNVLPPGKFLFRSTPMVLLFDTVRRVAVTDATVLVTGETGTGKEILSQALHTLSPRHAKPFIIVDCGAIPASLMDSELFGRERGAYTGAERRAPGRLAQADGGTICLDEIGELPLEVQAKLLRFVQEKTLTMVGATQPKRVDVRIVAATNRALEEEVRAGRFREDLFHRLNVIRLKIPPLRERPGDVALLAQHFLQASWAQFGARARGFEDDAMAFLTSRTWPGNVRELQNTILQAAVLSDKEMIDAADLQRLDATAAPPVLAAPGPVIGGSSATPVAESGGASDPLASHATHTDDLDPHAFGDSWRQLGDLLVAEVAGAARDPLPRPLGDWLEQDVVLAAYAWAGQVMSRAAQRLGLPDTTFSRRLRQAQCQVTTRRHPASWDAVVAAIAGVLKAADGAEGFDHLDAQIQDELFVRVASSLASSTRMAAILGVSAPTLKRRMADLARRQPDRCA